MPRTIAAGVLACGHPATPLVTNLSELLLSVGVMRCLPESGRHVPEADVETLWLLPDEVEPVAAPLDLLHHELGHVPEELDVAREPAVALPTKPARAGSVAVVLCESNAWQCVK